MKTKLKIVVLIILALINLVLFYTERFVTLPYVLGNITIFTLFVFIAFIIIDMFTKLLLKRNLTEQKQNIVIISRTVVFFLIVVLVGSSQLIYIQKKDTLYQRRCEYYDEYNNIIYESLYVGVCPDLEILVQNDDELVFEVKQEAIGTKNFDTFKNRGISIDEVDGSVNVNSLSNIAIHYDDNHFVSTFDIKLSEYITYYQSGLETQILFSYHRVVENTLGGSFESIVKEAEYLEYSNRFVEVLSHHVFNDSDYLEYRLYESNIQGIEDPIGDSTIIREEILSEGVTISDMVLELRHSDSQIAVDAYYDANWDTPIFTENSLFSEDGYINISKRTSVDLKDDHQYSLNYMERNGVFYLDRMGIIKDFGPNMNYHSTYNHVWYENKSEEYTYLSNGTNDVVEFHETNYGMKVVNRRIFKFNYFRGNEEQLLEVTFKYNFDDYRRLHNYYLELTDMKYYDPQYILRDYNPLYLLD